MSLERRLPGATSKKVQDFQRGARVLRQPLTGHVHSSAEFPTLKWQATCLPLPPRARVQAGQNPEVAEGLGAPSPPLPWGSPLRPACLDTGQQEFPGCSARALGSALLTWPDSTRRNSRPLGSTQTCLQNSKSRVSQASQ